MTQEEQQKMMMLTKDVKTQVELNALEVKFLIEVLTDYNTKLESANKLKRFRSNKDFQFTRQLAKAIVDKFEVIHNQNKIEYEKLTELQKESIN